MNATELRAQRGVLSKAIDTLKSERATLAPLAINGDARRDSARERIREIDIERAALVSELETVDQALASPEYRQLSEQERAVERRNVHYARNKPKMVERLRNMIENRWLSLAHGNNLQALGKEDIELLPRKMAAEFTGEDVLRFDLAALKAHAIEPDRVARLEAELAAVTHNTEDLLASIQPMPHYPQDLAEKLRLQAVRLGRKVPAKVTEALAWHAGEAIEAEGESSGFIARILGTGRD